jgi:hypothetical protein
MNIFEQASRLKLRFNSLKGELTTEQLWDLPLQAKNSCDLDTVAKAVNQALLSVTTESFVSTTVSPAQPKLALALEVVKHVIAVKIAENEASRKAVERAAQRQKLLGALANKQEQELQGLSAEEIGKRLAELDA